MPRKPDRFERVANEFFQSEGPFYAVEVADLLRAEHRWMVRMVKKNLKFWASTSPYCNEIDPRQYGRECRAAQCIEILSALKQRRK